MASNTTGLLFVSGNRVMMLHAPYNPDFRTAVQISAAMSSITNASPMRQPLDGMKGILSQYVREDVASTGKNTLAGPNDKTYALVINPQGWRIGRWRDRSESNEPIDASGTMPDGTSFNGPRELRQALLRNPERFIATFTEKLLTYALGRGLTHADGPAVRAIMRGAAQNDYRLSSVVLGIVSSPPFQMRRSPS